MTAQLDFSNHFSKNRQVFLQRTLPGIVESIYLKSGISKLEHPSLKAYLSIFYHYATDYIFPIKVEWSNRKVYFVTNLARFYVAKVNPGGSVGYSPFHPPLVLESHDILVKELFEDYK